MRLAATPNASLIQKKMVRARRDSHHFDFLYFEQTDVIRRSHFPADVTDPCLQGFSRSEQERSPGEPQAVAQSGDEVLAVHALPLPDVRRSAGEPQFGVQPGDEAPAVHVLLLPGVRQASQLSA